MTVELREIDSSNWLACVRLQVREEQKGFVSPNAFSLAQACYEPWWKPMAIYDGETMVGFVMFSRAYDEEWGYWITRVMVDQEHQRKGYGRAAIPAVLRLMSEFPNCTSVRISEKPGNTVARALYISLGFEETGEVIGGEDVQRYTFPVPSGI